MFAKQKKLCLGFSNMSIVYCASGQDDHEIKRGDILNFEEPPRNYRRVSRRDRWTPRIQATLVLRMKATRSGIIWLLEMCRNLQVLVITQSLWNAFAHESGVTCLSDVCKTLLPFVSEKLSCLIIEPNIYISQHLTRQLNTRPLQHLAVSEEMTESSKKLLRTKNPSIIISVYRGL